MKIAEFGPVAHPSAHFICFRDSLCHSLSNLYHLQRPTPVLHCPICQPLTSHPRYLGPAGPQLTPSYVANDFDGHLSRMDTGVGALRLTAYHGACK